MSYYIWEYTTRLFLLSLGTFHWSVLAIALQKRIFMLIGPHRGTVMVSSVIG